MAKNRRSTDISLPLVRIKKASPFLYNKHISISLHRVVLDARKKILTTKKRRNDTTTKKDDD